MPHLTKTDLTGERGVIHVHQVCVEMGFLWHPISGKDVGIDGSIEPADDNGCASGCQIQVQIKSGPSYFHPVGAERFYYLGDADHFEYWRGANTPVILILYHPGENTAYWVDVKAYLRLHPDALKRPFKIHFDRQANRFDRNSAAQLRTLVSRSLGSLPPPPAFVGRQEMLAEVVEAILEHNGRHLLLLGPPGIGKSTLAVKALHHPDVRRQFGLRRCFIRCDGARAGGEILSLIASGLDMPAGAQMDAWVHDKLEASPALLVLDNLETAWELDIKGTEEVLALLAGIMEIRLIVTLRGNQWPGGDIDWQEPFRLGRLDEAESRELFAHCGGENHRNAPQLEPLLKALDGLPLAISLMAHQVQSEPDLGGLWERWSAEHTAMLRRGKGDDRRHSLPVSVELSIQAPRMTGPARTLMSCLALLPDGMMYDDLALLRQGPENVTVKPLRDTGLVFDDVASRRLRMLAPVRDYIRDNRQPRLEDSTRVAVHYLNLTADLGPNVGRPGGAVSVRRLGQESGNIEAMISSGLNGLEPVPAIDAALGLTNFLVFSGLGTPRILDSARDKARQISDRYREAACLRSLADIALARSEYPTAQTHLEQERDLRRILDDQVQEAGCILRLGHVARYLSEPQRGRSYYREAVRLCCHADSAGGMADCYKGLGHAALARGKVGKALGLYASARSLYERQGDVCETANCTRSLGFATLQRRLPNEASGLFLQALSTFKEIGALRNQADCMRGLGQVAFDQVRFDAAEQHWEESLQLYREVKYPRGEAGIFLRLGELAARRDDQAHARSCYEQALTLYKSLPSWYSIGTAHAGLSRAASNPDEGRRQFELAREAWLRAGRGSLVQVLQAELEDRGLVLTD